MSMKLLISLTCAASGALTGLLLAGIGGMIIGAASAFMWAVGSRIKTARV